MASLAEVLYVKAFLCKGHPVCLEVCHPGFGSDRERLHPRSVWRCAILGLVNVNIPTEVCHPWFASERQHPTPPQPHFTLFAGVPSLVCKY